MNKNEPSNGIKCTNWELGRQSTQRNESQSLDPTDKLGSRQRNWGKRAFVRLYKHVECLAVTLWVNGCLKPTPGLVGLWPQIYPQCDLNLRVRGTGRPSQDQPALAHHCSIPFPANKSLCWGCYYQWITHLPQECLHLLRQLTQIGECRGQIPQMKGEQEKHTP